MTADPIDDQVRAAAEHAHHVLRAVGQVVGGEWRRAGEQSTTRRRVDEWLASARGGNARPCRHAERTPQPVMAYLAVPDVIVCARAACHARLRRIYLDSVPADECDACRRPARGGWFHEVTASAGPLLLHANVCVDCFAELPAARL